MSRDPAKVEVIQNLPAPTSVKQVRSFIGSYILYTEASHYVVGAILVQNHDSGMERVIQYVSQALSTSQRKWTVCEKECFSISVAIDLYGAQFVINTDHKALTSLFTKQMNNTRIQRWAILLAECNAEIKYLPGKYNGRADMCSRIPVPQYISVISVIDTSENYGVDTLACPEQRREETLPLMHDGLNIAEIALQQKVEFAQEFRLATDVLHSVKRPYIYADDFPRLLLPAKFRPAVIYRAHREVGHLSHATVTRVAEAYSWPLLRQSLRDAMAKCATSFIHNTRHGVTTMVEMHYANANHQIISVDLYPSLPKGTGIFSLLLIIFHYGQKRILFRIRQTNLFGMHLQIIICHGFQRQ